MSDITHNDPLVTESKLTEFYNDIKPFLGCPAYVTQEGDEMYFSSEEKVVGRWTDGKPIYKKTINCGAASSRNYSVNHNITNLEKVIMFWGAARTGNRWDFLPYPTPDSITYQVRVDVLTTGTIRFSYGSGADLYSEVYVTLLYTKTTDSASTTIEQKPTHYSTDEQVVGTWIDGKPVYQKTYNLTNTVELTKDNWTVINEVNDLANVNAIIDCNVFTSGGTFMVVHASLDSNKLKLGAPNSSNFRYIIKIITIKYLKSTD